MQTVLIEISHDFVDGGCNACPTVRCENYMVHVQGKSRVLEILDCQCLIQEIAICEGYSFDYVMDMEADYVEFEKNGRIVRFKEEYGQLTYSCAMSEIVIVNVRSDLTKMVPIVNEVLLTIFDLEEYKIEKK